jgi:thiol-disulfide isomerase/thioredoxin
MSTSAKPCTKRRQFLRSAGAAALFPALWLPMIGRAEAPFQQAASAQFDAAARAAGKAPARAGEPRVYGVLFYADWCPKCKVLKPELERARLEDQLDNEDVLFVRLDLTDETTSHQAQLMANALGLEDFYVENEGRTGFMLLIDPTSGQAIDRLTKSLSAEEISARIDSALKKLI